MEKSINTIGTISAYEGLGTTTENVGSPEWIGKTFSFATLAKGNSAKLKEIEKAAQAFAAVVVKAIPGTDNARVLRHLHQVMQTAGAALTFKGLAI